jgi:hypothetical protein
MPQEKRAELVAEELCLHFRVTTHIGRSVVCVDVASLTSSTIMVHELKNAPVLLCSMSEKNAIPTAHVMEPVGRDVSPDYELDDSVHPAGRYEIHLRETDANSFSSRSLSRARLPPPCCVRSGAPVTDVSQNQARKISEFQGGVNRVPVFLVCDYSQ